MKTADSHAHLPVVIAGAGIVGVASAIWLQRAGIPVLIFDPRGPAQGASFGNAGVLAACSVVPLTVPGLIAKAPRMLLDRDEPLFLRWPYLPRLTPWLLRYLSHCRPEQVRRIAAAMAPLVVDTLSQHRALSQGTPASVHVHAGDYVYGYRDRAHFDADAFGWQVRRDNGFNWAELDRQALRSFDPVFGDDLGFAVRVPGHGRIDDPGRYVSRLAEHVISQGGLIRHEAVDDVHIVNGMVRAVIAGGQRIPCRSFLITAGAWSGPLSTRLGLKVPLESERGYHLDLWEPDRMPRQATMIAALKVVATPMDGRIRLAGAVEFGGIDAPRSDPPFAMLERAVSRVFPDLRWARTERWMGHRPAPADSIPLIGTVPGLSNAWLGFGHHHVGMTAGPRTGRLLATLIAGTQAPDIDMQPYAPSRFAN